MIKKTIYYALISLCTVLALQPSYAQEISHRQADDFADWLVADGQHAKAAGLYADAFQEKSRALYAYKAAELYFDVKDYAKAAMYYNALAKDDNSDFPLAKWKYAKSLKQMGKYVEAIEFYNSFKKGYQGEDSTHVRALVENEIKGAQFAIDEQSRVDPTIFVDRLGQSINSMKNEIAPILNEDGSLTYVSDFDGTMRIYNSRKERNGWSQMRPAKGFPLLATDNINGVAISEDDRIYMSICDQSQNMVQPNAKCKIHVINKIGNTWSDPKPLKGEINTDNSTSSHPFVYVEDGNEVMIFASNRSDGFGGLDLWKAVRPVGAANFTFSDPINLGSKINGLGNEVTPFYNTETRVLSYSTTSGVTLGGYDVVQSTFQDDETWTNLSNPGTPINSTGDDYHYMEIPKTSIAYLSSNRMEDLSATSFVNDDIYQVTYDNPNISIEFLVIDEKTGMPLSDPTINVQLNPDGRMLKPFLVRRSTDGYFSLTLPVDRDIVVDIKRPYFDDATTTIYLPEDAKDGHDVASLRLERTPITKDDILVVSRSSEDENSNREVMTASGDDDNN